MGGLTGNCAKRLRVGWVSSRKSMNHGEGGDALQQLFAREGAKQIVVGSCVEGAYDVVGRRHFCYNEHRHVDSYRRLFDDFDAVEYVRVVNGDIYYRAYQVLMFYLHEICQRTAYIHTVSCAFEVLAYGIAGVIVIKRYDDIAFF